MGSHKKREEEGQGGDDVIKKEKKRKRSHESTGESDHKKRKHLDSVQPLVAGPSERGIVKMPHVESNVVASLEDSEQNAATLEEKLQAYSSAMLVHEASNNKANASTIAPPSSDSLVVLVEQALQSGDDILLEQCLACDDSDIIDVTTSNLPTAKIFLFMRRLISKFEKRPSRGLLLTRWLSAVLKHHASFLISVPELSSKLAGLSQIMEQRLASYSRLASLGGRLDLLMSHVSARGASAKKNSSTAEIPRISYREP